LKLILTVGESAALILLEVLTRLAEEPELAQLGLDLLLPGVLTCFRGAERLSTIELEVDLTTSGRVEIFIVAAALVLRIVHTVISLGGADSAQSAR